jgi:hypothetical protein
MIDLEHRLVSLGDELALDDADLVDQVLARLDEPGSAWRNGRPWIRVAAAAAIVVALIIAAVPAPRRTVAGWLGFDQVRIERRPDLSVPTEPDPFESTTVVPTEDGAAPTVPDSLPVQNVDGREILVSVIDGRLDDGLLTKTLGSGTAIIEVDVAGHRGLWIDGEPHDVMFETPDGAFMSQRFAGNTLLWQVGDVLYRVEGFGSLDAALKFAATMGTP